MGVHRETQGYIGVHWVTQGYTGLHRTTGNYIGVHKVTQGYIGIHWVTQEYTFDFCIANMNLSVQRTGYLLVCHAFVTNLCIDNMLHNITSLHKNGGSAHDDHRTRTSEQASVFTIQPHSTIQLHFTLLASTVSSQSRCSLSTPTQMRS